MIYFDMPLKTSLTVYHIDYYVIQLSYGLIQCDNCTSLCCSFLFTLITRILDFLMNGFNKSLKIIWIVRLNLRRDYMA